MNVAEGGLRHVTAQHRIRSSWQKQPLAMLSSIGGCWQKARFAKLQLIVAVLDVPGPFLPFGGGIAAFLKAAPMLVAAVRAFRQR
jgi:hypothetical protein